MTDSIDRLYQAVLAARDGDPKLSRTSRLLQSSRAKMAKKMAEEAIEVVIDAMNGKTDAVVRESADLMYNLVVLWAASGVHPQDVWDEMQRREKMLGIAEKLPKSPKITSAKIASPKIAAVQSQPRAKVVRLSARRAPKLR